MSDEQVEHIRNFDVNLIKLLVHPMLSWMGNFWYASVVVDALLPRFEVLDCWCFLAQTNKFLAIFCSSFHQASGDDGGPLECVFCIISAICIIAILTS